MSTKKDKIELFRVLSNKGQANVLTPSEIKFLKSRGINIDKLKVCKVPLIINASDSKAKADIIYRIGEKLQCHIIRFVRHIVGSTSKMPGVIPIKTKAVIEDKFPANAGKNQYSEVSPTMGLTGITRNQSSDAKIIKEISEIADESEEVEPKEKTYKMSFPSVWDDIEEEDNYTDMKIRTYI